MCQRVCSQQSLVCMYTHTCTDSGNGTLWSHLASGVHAGFRVKPASQTINFDIGLHIMDVLECRCEIPTSAQCSTKSIPTLNFQNWTQHNIGSSVVVWANNTFYNKGVIAIGYIVHTCTCTYVAYFNKPALQWCMHNLVWLRVHVHVGSQTRLYHVVGVA